MRWLILLFEYAVSSPIPEGEVWRVVREWGDVRRASSFCYTSPSLDESPGYTMPGKMSRELFLR